MNELGIMALLKSILPCALGSMFSFLVTKPEEPRWQVFATFFAGVSIGHIFGNAIIEYYIIDPLSYSSTCIKFTLGLLGLFIIKEAMRQLPLFVEAFRNKWLDK